MQSVQFRLVFASLFILGIGMTTSSCYIFRKKSSDSGNAQGASGGVIGESLGPTAYGPNEAALETLYAVTTPHAPAGVRPDPDLFVRQLLLQYREPGSTVAREIGRVEQFRSLLGGANVNFSVVPQETYDATSLLAEMKVAEEVCEGLVNPNGHEHPGWTTILPAAPSDADTNISFLFRRLIGSPTVDEISLGLLKEILNTALNEEGSINNASYIPVCVTLVVDAEGLLL